MHRIFGSLALAAMLASGSIEAAAKPSGSHGQRIAITVTTKGFEPSSIHLGAGRPVTLVVTRTTERTCAADFVVKEYGIKQALPLGRPVEIRFTPRRAGAIRYACAMGMVAGSLVVE